MGESPRVYATRKWGRGTVIGIHLDRWNGTLQFFQDGAPLGIAFRGKLPAIKQ